MERLYDFTGRLGGVVNTADIAGVTLAHVRDDVRAQVAELVLPGAPQAPTGWRLDDGGLRRLAAVNSSDGWWVPALHGESVLLPPSPRQGRPHPGRPADGMAVPLVLDEGQLAVLIVENSLVDIAGFQREDLRLFEAMANHAAVALANARLVERLRRQAAELEFAALHDPLTGLPNRRCFHQQLEAALAGCDEQNALAVLLMDLNGFKDVNDTLGHDTGDRLLVQVGARLRRRLHGRGLVARLGGDEFAVLMTGARDLEEVRWMAEEVVRSIGSPICLEQLTLDVRASMGVALAPLHGREARILMRRADVAMYVAKTARSGTEIYAPGDDHNSHRRLVLLGSLRHAIESGQIHLAYQPKVHAVTHEVVGVEALVRWDHPELGQINPEEFVSLAEQAGLIRHLTLFVLESALRQCTTWRAAGHEISVAVNLSTRNLLDVALPDDIARLLLQTRLRASALTLEITESSIMADPVRCTDVLDRIAALDVTLSIDDFGTGYSSLAYLKRLPVREVKIDKSFVLGLTSERGDRSIVRATVRLAHELGLHVVAEGVEDEKTHRFLAFEGCDVVQGFLFTAPLAPAALEAWLSSRTKTIDLTKVG
ncbi:MAG: EAL domain-containing protein [Actinomycetota bacterium]|nr:EAL domain-containing protein [Actinomycetota bacterium]